MLAQGAAGADDIGDHIGHPELDGNLDGTVQPDDLGFDAFGGQILSDQVGVRGGDSLSRDVVDRPVRPAGAAYRKVEPQIPARAARSPAHRSPS